MKLYTWGTFTSLLLFLIITSCDKQRVFERNIRIPDNKWDAKNIIHFDVGIFDTVSPHTIYINIRNSSSYKFSNLFVFIDIEAPNGNSVRDTFEIVLADKYGKWLGKGVGNVFFLQAPYKKNIQFPFKGIYTFDIEQAMWEKQLPGITDVGLRIEKQK